MVQNLVHNGYRVSEADSDEMVAKFDSETH